MAAAGRRPGHGHSRHSWFGDWCQPCLGAQCAEVKQSGGWEKVARTPSSVVLTFDEPAIALGTKLVITGPEGPAQIGKPRLVDNTVTQDLQPGAPAGTYTVDWRVTSADGHPISGSFTFTAEAAAAGVPSTTPSLAPQPSSVPTAQTVPTARGSSGLWLVAGAIIVVASGLAAIGRRRLSSRGRS